MSRQDQPQQHLAAEKTHRHMHSTSVSLASDTGFMRSRAPYAAVLAAFMGCLALTLLGFLDIRRGFLFAAYPVRTHFFAFTPLHLGMVAAGVAGMWASQRELRRREAPFEDRRGLVRIVALLIFTLLVADLFAYRGVPAARSLAAGQLRIDWLAAFGVTTWWKPVAQATSYLFTVWHATALGLLLSALALTALPVLRSPYIRRDGLAGSLFGALFALPQPFCSCCSSVMAPSLVRRGASTTFVLSFVLGAPMLNVTTIVLAVALLPARFAVIRILAGFVVTVLVTHVVARLADRSGQYDAMSPSVSGVSRAPRWLAKAWDAYLALFNLDRLIEPGPVATPAQLFSRWLRVTGRLALVLVPTLWVWSVVASVLFQILPSAFGNNLPSVILAAFGGTFLMISTWSEIPMALALINAGYDGPAAALLVVLPAISLPCMMLLGGALRRFRMIAALSGAVIITGIAAGSFFLY